MAAARPWVNKQTDYYTRGRPRAPQVISHKGLIHLRNNLPVNVRAHLSTSNELQLETSIHQDNLVHVYKSPDEYEQDVHSENLCTILATLLEEDLQQELHGVTVTTKSFMSKALLRSVGNSKIVTSLTLNFHTIC